MTLGREPSCLARIEPCQLSRETLAQDSRLAVLEQGLQAIREDHAQARKEDRAENARQLQAVETQVSSIAKELGDQLKMQCQLMQDAQLRQQEQMQASMDELKALFGAPSPPARKQPRNGDTNADL